MARLHAWPGLTVLALFLPLLLSLSLSGCDGAGTPTQKFTTTDITGGPWGKDFRMTDHNGVERTLADFEGKAVVLAFGFTHCPDVCPTTMTRLASVKEKLGRDAERVQVLMATLDPKRDTPEILKAYVPAFHPSFLGLHGSEEQIDLLTKEFKVMRAVQSPDEKGHYTVDHSAGMYAFDPQGRLRLYISDEHGPDVIASDLKTLLES